MSRVKILDIDIRANIEAFFHDSSYAVYIGASLSCNSQTLFVY